MFSFFKDTFSKLYQTVTVKLSSLFSRSTINEQTLQELENLFLQADVGVKTTHFLIEHIKQAYWQKKITSGADLQLMVKDELSALLHTPSDKQPHLYMLVGINGSGKTTFVAKLAYHFTQQGKKVLVAAADTFRAAACQQLKTWAERADADIVIGKENQDPGSVVFTACQKFLTEHYDILIIDTAGRLQTNVNLMNELEKIKRIVQKQLPTSTMQTLLTIDAMLGQNSLEQARLFDKSLKLDGIVLTKMDGTGKGGIIFAINHELSLPVFYLSYGEKIDDMIPFDSQKFVEELVTKT